MIVDLASVICRAMHQTNGNNGNNGNNTREPAPILNRQKENLFPFHKNGLGTTGTTVEPSVNVPTVPVPKNENGNTTGDENIIEKQQVITPVPTVPSVPVKKIDATTKNLPLPGKLIPWTTSSGRTVRLITDERVRPLVPAGIAAFSLDEIEALRGLPDAAIETAISVKEVFPGSTIVEP